MDIFAKRAEALGHKLIRHDDGQIDIFVLDIGYHNGPGCEVCHESWCHHCKGPDDIQPCDGGASHRAYIARRDHQEWRRLIETYDADGPLDTTLSSQAGGESDG